MDMVDFGTEGPAAGSLPGRWNHGCASRRRCAEPPLQVHAYEPHTVILRQSKAVSYEAPFLYLLFGNDRAVLFDTGATADRGSFPLRATVDRLISEWLDAHPRAGYELVVAHTHGHGDHVAADGQFEDRSATTVVGRPAEAVREFFGFSHWPAELVSFDLGGRVLEVTGIPGHHPASIAVHDPWTGFLLTGDTVYPGRLYAPDFPAFTGSLTRLAALADSRNITRVMGCHIEMTRTPGRDYPIGCRYQPDEATLAMTVGQLHAVRDAALAVASRPGAHMFPDFAIYNGPCRRAIAAQLARSALVSVSGRQHRMRRMR